MANIVVRRIDMKKLMIGALLVVSSAFAMETNDNDMASEQGQQQDSHKETEKSIVNDLNAVNNQLLNIVHEIEARNNGELPQVKQHHVDLIELDERLEEMEAENNDDQDSEMKRKFRATTSVLRKTWLTACKALAKSGDVQAQMILAQYYVGKDNKEAASMCQRIIDNQFIPQQFRDIFSTLKGSIQKFDTIPQEKK